MSWLPAMVMGLALAVFFGAVTIRFIFWWRMPMHLRWELYPVGRADGSERGGSYFQQSEWWTKSYRKPLGTELRAMFEEILFLVALREHNRGMWYFSFPFHFGLYLVAASTVLLAALALLSEPPVEGPLVMILTSVATVGITLSIVGSAGLLWRRIRLKELRDYSSYADYFNLSFFVLVFGLSLLGILSRGTDFFAELHGYLASLASPGNLALLSFWPFLSLLLMSLLVAYIPLTHMSHFVAKAFAYHSIRWNDEPNLPGGRQEKRIAESLQRPISWSAPHIEGDGVKTWAQVATGPVRKEEPR